MDFCEAVRTRQSIQGARRHEACAIGWESTALAIRRCEGLCNS